MRQNILNLISNKGVNYNQNLQINEWYNNNISFISTNNVILYNGAITTNNITGSYLTYNDLSDYFYIINGIIQLKLINMNWNSLIGIKTLLERVSSYSINIQKVSNDILFSVNHYGTVSMENIFTIPIINLLNDIKISIILSDNNIGVCVNDILYSKIQKYEINNTDNIVRLLGSNNTSSSLIEGQLTHLQLIKNETFNLDNITLYDELDLPSLRIINFPRYRKSNGIYISCNNKNNIKNTNLNNDILSIESEL